jgi:RNA recognition motif-containing protein
MHDCLAHARAGWQLENSISQAFMADAALPPATQRMNKQAAVIAASVLDCVGAAVYFVVTLALILVARRCTEDADVHTVTLSDYSVYVRQLPGDARAQELMQFFGQFGEVRVLWPGRAHMAV